MPQLSVVIITFNEEKNIGRCLESVQAIADDIVVVDSFSSDKTEDICKQFNVNFIQRKWEGYSDTKNFANSQAKFDWILSLDADEAPSEELKRSILKAKQ
ncbi:MAG: glycosyltransferase family 2 protein, partial [Bacteroidia bacterium]